MGKPKDKIKSIQEAFHLYHISGYTEDGGNPHYLKLLAQEFGIKADKDGVYNFSTQ